MNQPVCCVDNLGQPCPFQAKTENKKNSTEMRYDKRHCSTGVYIGGGWDDTEFSITCLE